MSERTGRIIERKWAQEALRKSEEKYRRIVTTAGEGFILMDEDMIITDVNEAFCRLIGYEKEGLLGKTPFDFGAEEFRHFLRTNQKMKPFKEYRKFEGFLKANNDRRIPILIHGSKLRDDSGISIGNMAFITDLTEQKKALALAAEVQKSLLPQYGIHIPGLDVAGRNISCDEIGGDYFDFLEQKDYPNAPLSIVVGDIAGHGVDAALLMTTARAFLRMPAVSYNRMVRPFQSQSTDIESRVMPASGPVSSRSSPIIRLISVDFPDPDGPTKAINSPSWTTKSNPWSATISKSAIL